MSRLNEERQLTLEPQRMESTRKALEDLGCQVEQISNSTMKITTPTGFPVAFWPYSGWFSGKKPVGSARGFSKLVAKLRLVGARPA